MHLVYLGKVFYNDRSHHTLVFSGQSWFMPIDPLLESTFLLSLKCPCSVPAPVVTGRVPRKLTSRGLRLFIDQRREMRTQTDTELASVTQDNGFEALDASPDMD